MASAGLAVQQSAVRPGEGFRAGHDGDRHAIRDRRLAEESGEVSASELIALAKANPGTSTTARAAPARRCICSPRCSSSIAGIDLVHIPYRGDAPMITALIVRRHPARVPAAGQRHRRRQGKLIRGLGVTGTKRMEALPDVPTAPEQGIKGLEVGSWVALFAPAGTPPDVVMTFQQSSPRRWPIRRCATG